MGLEIQEVGEEEVEERHNQVLETQDVEEEVGRVLETQ